jgi:hypothetical protein
MTETEALLQREYEQLIRAVGRDDLLERTEYPDFERLVTELLDEAHAGEVREGTGLGIMHEKSREELMLAVRERLGNRRGLAFPLDLAYGEVRQACQEYGYTLPFPVLVAEFPTGSFNAQAVRMKHGTLLLINTGLMMLFYQCAKLIMRSFSFRIDDDDTAATRARAAPTLSHEKLVASMTQAVIAYLVTGRSTNAPRSEMSTGVAGMLGGYLARAAEKFVVGHELGHAVAGHLSTAKAVRFATSIENFSLDVIPKSWEQEIEADVYGIRFLIPPSKMTIATREELEHLSLTLAGAYLFFGLDKLFADLDLKLNRSGRPSVLESNHPPAELRSDAVTMYLEKIGAEQALSISMILRQLFSELTSEVSDRVVTQLGRL